MKTMRKKHQIYQSPRVKIEQLPKAFCPSETAGNIQTQKERFLKHGKTPIFVIKGDTASVEELSTKANGHIRFEYLGEAEYILRKVKEEYGVGENYLDHIYGPRIKQEEANDLLMDYINKNSLHESLDVFWSHNITCSARMVWRGLNNKCNKPESRRYSLWVNGTEENPYLRRTGFVCLLDHEIGTHFFRTFNDGLQPWFSDRKRFDLRSAFSFEAQCTEEGLAAIHTALRAGEHYLWLAALVYYTACKSTEMTFRQLFDHIEQFIQNPEQRWKHVMRVKRGLVDPNDLGGYGKDQCYFEGAVNILRNIDTIDFALLMSGKICYDEVNRIKRLARMNCIHLPAFMRDMEKYRAKLKQMAVLNGLNLLHPLYEPSPKYLWRLQQRQAGIKPRTRKVRKKRKLHASLSKVSHTGSEESVGSSVQASSSCVSCSESTDSILSFNMDSLLTGYLPRNTAVEQEQEKENIKQRQTPTGGLADKIGASLMETYMSKPKEELEKRVILLRTIKNKAAGDGRQKMADGPSMAHKTQSSLIQAARERIGSGSSSKSQSEAAREWIGSGSSKSQSQAARERIGSGSSSKSQSQAARERIGSCSSGKSQSQAARAQIGSGSSRKSQSEVAREQIGSGSSSNSHTLSVCKQSLSEAGGRHLEDGGRSSGASHEPSAKVNNKQSLDDATEDTDGHCVTLQRLSLGVAEKHTGYLPRLATCSGLKEVSGVLEDNSVMAHIDQLSISGTQTPSSACDLVKESAGAVLADIDSQKKSVVVFTPLQMTGRTDADGVTKRRINNTFMQTPSMAETWSTSGEASSMLANLNGV